MRVSKTLYPLLVPALVAMGCSSEGQGTVDAGPITSNPIVPEVAAYPFPSDFYLERDPSTATGRAIAMPQEALPDRVAGATINGMDGFSRLPLITTYLPGGVDPQSLPALDDHAASVAEDAPVLLIEAGTWRAIPILAESDLTAQRDQDRALLIRPLQLLDANAGYVVIIRDTLRNYQGDGFAPSRAFAALRDGTATTDPSIESQREAFELVLEAIAERDIAAETVVQAWSFHTRSEEGVSEALLAVQDLANVAELGEYSILSDAVEENGEGISRQIVGYFKAPNFLDDDGLIALDSDNRPEQRGTRDVEFSLTIPVSIDEMRPVVLYGHGFLGSYVQATRGSVNDVGHEYRFSSVGTNIGLNEDNQKLLVRGITDLEGLKLAVADVQQNMANQTALVRLVRETLADDITEDRGQGPFKVLDPDNVHYFGISNGGTFGTLATATSAQFERAVLMVGGGGLIHFLERAVQWPEYAGIVNLAYREPRERQLVFSIIQMILDPIDPINYARHLVYDRYPGRNPMTAMVIMAVNDSQVRNLVSEWTARTAGLPLVVPSPKEVYGLTTTSAAGEGLEGPGGFFVYDEQVEPSPLGNLPPAEDNKTHGTLRYVETFRKQLGTYIETGKMIQFCDGPCDPT